MTKPNASELKSRAFAEVDALRGEAVAIAKDLHAHPEVGWRTQRSADLLTDYLEKHGMFVEKAVAELGEVSDVDCSFRASIPGHMGGGVGVALLAEYDALPGLGHGCSHNLIGTIAATAGIAVRRALGDVPGNVYVMGCPFEEGGGGKIYMIDAGVFDVADVSIMWHGSSDVRVGSPNIAASGMTYTFTGKSAHSGANPHQGINAADAAMLTFAGVNALRQHVTSDVRIHGIIEDGGVAANSVPDKAVVRMMTRAASYKNIERVRERVHDCARGAALMTGAKLEIAEDPVYAERLVVPGLREVVIGNLGLVGLERPDGDPQTFASADSGNVSQYIPHVTFNLPLDTKGSVPHTVAFAEACNTDMAWDALVTAAKIMAASAIDLILDPERVSAIKAEHAALKG
ncbi:MAG: M20 family metallopeptidase [Trueperaceae bacterium]|jgi:amidohydrolase|nr:M20 family metallopeptidase [Trueperaceae bacterium]MCO5175199.1 M20 family metallopeptidase [Trueperaceae bacterium]MCW5819682.1 M20 family metallopeptidase [Trueperaceae bacterium]